MDELIHKYAEILRNARVGDYTYEGILAEFAREVRAYPFVVSQPRVGEVFALNSGE
jgi:hypothetical protein